MALITKPDISKVWASSGSKSTPPDAKIATGWGYEMMPFEWENYLQNRNDVALNHINQRGIPEWDALTEYQANRSYVTGSDGVVYRARLTSTGSDPITDAGVNWIRAFTGTSNNGDTSFYSGTTTVIEAMRLTAAGNLGIRINPTFSPSYSGLHVNNPNASQGAQIHLTNAGTGTTNVDGGALSSDAAGVMYVWNYENAPLILGVNNAEQVRITPAGGVGIGGSPSYKLDVLVTSSGDIFRVRNQTLAYEVKLGTSANSGYVDAGNTDLAFRRNGTEVGRFVGNGNLGIGTTTPTAKMHLYQASGAAGLTIENAASGGANFSQITWATGTGAWSAGTEAGGTGRFYIYNNAASLDQFRFGGGVNSGAYLAALGTAGITFATANATRMTILSNGNVGISATPTDYTGSSYRSLALNGSAGGIIEFQADGVQQARITGWNNSLAVHANNVEKIRITSTGLLVGRTAQSSGGTLEVSGPLVSQPATSTPTLGTDGDMTFQRVSNTQLRVLMRGSDGVTRTITLPIDGGDLTQSTEPVGSIKPMARMTAPTGWLLIDGKTIGSAASGATARANEDTFALFEQLWAFPNASTPIFTSAGVASVRGVSAAADFAANKRIQLFTTDGGFFLRMWTPTQTLDAGRAVGSLQGPDIQSHTHNIVVMNNDTAGGTFVDGTSSSGASGSQATDPTGGSETRPFNLSMPHYIKL